MLQMMRSFGNYQNLPRSSYLDIISEFSAVAVVLGMIPVSRQWCKCTVLVSLTYKEINIIRSDLSHFVLLCCCFTSMVSMKFKYALV